MLVMQASSRRARRPRLKPHLQEVSAGAAVELLAKPTDNRLRDEASPSPRFDLGERLLRERHIRRDRSLEREPQRLLEPFLPELGRHSVHLSPDVCLVAAPDCHRDEAQAGKADSEVVDTDLESIHELRRRLL
jgi:hypothetical protein